MRTSGRVLYVLFFFYFTVVIGIDRLSRNSPYAQRRCCVIVINRERTEHGKTLVCLLFRFGKTATLLPFNLLVFTGPVLSRHGLQHETANSKQDRSKHVQFAPFFVIHAHTNCWVLMYMKNTARSNRTINTGSNKRGPRSFEVFRHTI